MTREVRRVRRHSPGHQQGQAMVETALLILPLLALMLVFGGAIVVAEATVELRSATTLAAASAFAAPLGAPTQATANVRDSFERSLRDPFIGSHSIRCPAGEGNQYLFAGVAGPTQVISCHGDATVSLARGPLGVLWRWDIHLHQDVRLPVPVYRQCAPQRVSTC
jgi:hypothetical protein